MKSSAFANKNVNGKTFPIKGQKSVKWGKKSNYQLFIIDTIKI